MFTALGSEAEQPPESGANTQSPDQIQFPFAIGGDQLPADEEEAASDVVSVEGNDDREAQETQQPEQEAAVIEPEAAAIEPEAGTDEGNEGFRDMLLEATNDISEPEAGTAEEFSLREMRPLDDLLEEQEQKEDSTKILERIDKNQNGLIERAEFVGAMCGDVSDDSDQDAGDMLFANEM